MRAASFSSLEARCRVASARSKGRDMGKKIAGSDSGTKKEKYNANARRNASARPIPKLPGQKFQGPETHDAHAIFAIRDDPNGKEANTLWMLSGSARVVEAKRRRFSSICVEVKSSVVMA